MATLDLLTSTSVSLWRTSSYWKWTVISGGILTTLFAVNGLSPSSSTQQHGQGPTPQQPISRYSPTPGPVRPISVDPASDLRLSNYKLQYDAAQNVKDEGAKCEKIANAYGLLVAPGDLNRGRQLPTYQSLLDPGQQCVSKIQTSDDHFKNLANAVTQADRGQSPQTILSVINALNALDKFDRTRERFRIESGLISKATNYQAMIIASDNRIAAVTREIDSLSKDQSPAEFVKVADAFHQITSLDRSRLTPEQQKQVTIAEHSAANVDDARGRLDALPSLLPLAENGSASAAEPLVEAVAKIGVFDEAVATPEQKRIFEQARAKSIPLGWTLFKDRIAALGQDQTPATLERAAGLYRVLTSVPSGGLTAEQQELLKRGSEAAASIAASDVRLATLNKAASDWRSSGSVANETMLAALHALTPLDKARSSERDRASLVDLTDAESVAHARSLGFNAETKDRIKLLIQTAQSTPSDSDKAVAASLQARLKNGGFALARDNQEAAIIVQVSLQGMDEPSMSTEGAFVAFKTRAHLLVVARWAADSGTLFSSQFEGDGNGSDGAAARRAALSDGVNKVVDHFQSLTAK